MNRKRLLHPKLLLTTLLIAIAAGLMTITMLPTPKPEPDDISVDPGRSSRAFIDEAYGKLPLSFEANQGQVDDRFKFISRGQGYSLFLAANEAVLALKPHKEEANSALLHMKVVGADSSAIVTGFDELPGKVNYLIGNDPKQWRTNVPTYARVKYEEVYPGIDLVYYGNQRRLEYDFIVRPGADPNLISLGFDGDEERYIDENGDLVLKVDGGEVYRSSIRRSMARGRWLPAITRSERAAKSVFGLPIMIGAGRSL
jgi:hypothetical protein